MLKLYFIPILTVIALATPAHAETFSHRDWTEVLQRHVDDQGLVDYDALAADRAQLDRYLAAIDTHGPTRTPELFPTRADQLAYYINAYNALVFQGVLARGPETKSVWRGLGGARFFVFMKVRLDGKKTNLRALENKIVRARFEDPRIHAALNCASIACPRLPRVAFSAARLDAELDAAMTEFVNQPRHVRVDTEGNTVYLSEIFDWFESDFIDFESSAGSAAPSVIDYINRFRSPGDQLPTDASIRYIDYDKGINRQS